MKKIKCECTEKEESPEIDERADWYQLSRIADVLERFIEVSDKEKPEMSRADAYRKVFTALEEKAYIAMFQEELASTVTKVKGGQMTLEDAVASVEKYREMLVGKIAAEDADSVDEYPANESPDQIE